MSAKSPKSSPKTTRSTEEPTMKTTPEQTAIPTVESIKTLSGEALQAAYSLVFGEAPKPRTPVPSLRNKIVAELQRRAAANVESEQEQPASEPAVEVDNITAAIGITAAVAQAIHDSEEAAPTEQAAATEQPAVEVAPVASDVAVDAPTSEPAPIAAATDDATVANTDAPASEPAPTADARDMILGRLRTMEPAVQRVMLEGYAKAELLGLVERATGAKTSGRLSPASAIDRILAALTPAPAAEDKPAAESDTSTNASDTNASAGDTTTRGRATELPAVGTVLENVDRHGKVRATCTIVEGGVEFAGTVYTSLSAAAVAASKALGNTTKQTSGPRFWGLVDAKPRAKTAKGLDLDGLTRAFDKSRERAEALLKEAGADDLARVRAMLLAQSEALFALATPPAAEDAAATTEPEAA